MIKIRRLWILCLLIVMYYRVHAQGGNLSFTTVQPTDMYVCGEPKTFTITINNISSGLVDDPVLTIKLPTGFEYVPGSITGGAEQDISDLDSSLFTLADITAGSSVTITFQAIARCAAISLIENDVDIQNRYRVDYVGNYDEVLTSAYDLYRPSLVFQSITNQIYNGLVGQTFTRVITIKNSGDARLSAFTLDDVHGSGIQVNSISPGTFNNIGLTARVQLGTAEFMTVGNNDGYLDPNEQIVITQSITILACSGLTSAYDMYWGCNSQVCDNTTQNGNVVIQNGVPNLTYAVTASNNICYGGSNISTQRLRVSNTGTEPARNVEVFVYQGYGIVQANYFYSRIDTSSLQYKIGNNNPLQNIDPTSVGNNTNYACFGSSDAISQFKVVIPYIQPGDTVYLEWNVYTCCQSTCNNEQYTNGWMYKITYKNQCLTNTYQTAEITGRYYSSLLTGQTVAGPPDISNGQTLTYNVVNTGWGNYPGNASNDRIIVRLVLPPGISWGGLLTLTDFNLNNFPVLSTYTSTGGDTVMVTFNYTLSMEKSEINFNITGNCGTAGTKNIQLTTIYQPTTSCPCNFDIRCTTIPVRLHCPSLCSAGGIDPISFDMRRYNYGLPDNDNNGSPDGMGSIDFNKVKVYQLLSGDTIVGTQMGVVRAGTGGSTWSHVYVRNYIPQGGNNSSRIIPISATATIYDASSGIYYNIPDVPTTRLNSNPNCTMQHDLSVPTLIGLGYLPGGFLFEDGDSISITYLYRLTRNTVPGNLINVTVRDTFFAAQMANPPVANRFFCDNFDANLTFVAFYFTTWGPQVFSASGCNIVTLQQNYYYSVGSCCNNYAGGNLFPFEYRSTTHFREMKVLLPTGYTFVSARIRETRGTGTQSTTTSAWQTITPDDPNANPLVFNVSNLYAINGGPLPMPDDGYHGNFELTIRGSCQVTDGVNQQIIYTHKHQFLGSTVGVLNPSNNGQDSVVSSSSNGDQILYTKPVFNLQSALPNITATLDSVFWDIQLTNITAVTANNTWFYPQSLNGKITVYKVTDLGTMTDVTPIGGLYRLNHYAGGLIKNYRIYARYTACNTDSLIIHVGWNCTGYPADLASYPCQTTKLTLKMTPERPQSSISVVAPIGSQNLCDTLTYETTISNINAGHGYEPMFVIRRPGGTVLIPGSAEIEYPSGSGIFVPMGNPLTIGLNNFWRLDTIVSQLNYLNGGLKGAPLAPNNAYKVRFKLHTTCSFVSGSCIRITSGLKGGCGTYYNNYFNLPIITIAGAPSNYTTSISIEMDTIRTCNSITVKAKVINLGAGTTNATDEFRLTISNGISYIAGSTMGVHNGPSGEPTLVALGGGDFEARWLIPTGIIPSDSMVFTFQIQGDPGSPSGNYTMDPYSVISASLPCGASTCNIFATTGTLSKDVVIDRPSGEWLGTVDTDWFNPLNWSDCVVPTCSKDVVIKAVPNQPVINTSQTASTQTLFLEPNTTVTLDPSARIDICGDLDISNMANFVSGTNAEVHFTGSTIQTFNNSGTANFELVFMEQTATSDLFLNHNLVINKTLTLTNGRIVTSIREVYVTNGNASSVNAGNSNSFVNGNLRRNIGQTGQFYLPVGNTTKGYELARVDFLSTGDVNQLYAFFNDWTGPLPVLGASECGATFNCAALDHGYWTINANAYTTAPLYDIFLYNNNYTNACASQTVMKSPTGANAWNILDGYCDPASTVTLTIRRDLTGFSDFAVAQSTLPLPVELVNLKATPLTQSILVSWNTRSEANARGFEIQRSIDAQNFTSIGWLDANNTPSAYQFIDNQVQPNTVYYYRLKQVDVDGRFVYSNTVEAMLKATAQMAVYPNPNHGSMEIMLEAPTETTAELQFVNALGQIVWTHQVPLQKGIQKLPIHLSLPAGVYQLILTSPEQQYTQKIVIE